MGKRRHARELALNVLLHLEFSRDEPGQAFDLICETFGAHEDIKNFSRELVQGVYTHIKELDRLIMRASEHWRLERISKIDRSILRIAVYELMYRNDIPPKVSINEAVDLGKKFGSSESSSFINGILDKIYTSSGLDHLSSDDLIKS